MTILTTAENAGPVNTVFPVCMSTTFGIEKSGEKSWFDAWVGKIPWKCEWLPTPGDLPWRIPWTEEPGGLSPWGRKELGMTEGLSL